MAKAVSMAAAIICLLGTAAFAGNRKPAASAADLYFIQNVGQITDPKGNVRDDIQFALRTPGLTMFIGSCGLHYQFIKSNTALSCNELREINKLPENNEPATFNTYRVDVELQGANLHAAAITEQPQAYYETYYLPQLNGAVAHTYRRIIYKDVYPGIDWVVCIADGKFEHKFIIRPGGNPGQIALKYSGHTSLKANADGSITAVTPYGAIKEDAPLCYRENGSQVPVRFKVNRDMVTYEMNGLNELLVIDPVVEWATYFGNGPDSSQTSYFYDATCDLSGNVYACGLTWSSTMVATSGTYESTHQALSDGFVVKFDSSGHRLWGTYYGGENIDWASAVGLDKSGNVYLAGSTSSTTGIATPGATLPTYITGGICVGFLARLDATGARQWGTYVGGTPGIDYDLEVTSVNCDTFGHVYISGYTDDTNNVATAGSFKPQKLVGVDTVQCYLVKYDTAGHRLWGTYYGGESHTFRATQYTGCSTTDGNNIYLAGATTCNWSGPLTTAGCYQPAYRGGVSDAFLAKFDSSGNRVWGTFYGGEGSDQLGGIAYSSGVVYILGATSSDSALASAGCYQPANAGGLDAFLASFESTTGFRNWGTFFGGPGTENTGGRIAADNTANVYIMGYTNSTSGIASAGAWQTTFGGGSYDCFFSEYNAAGTQLWSTYYGGSGFDWPYACTFDGKNPYLCGQTNSTDSIATSGSFLDTGGGSSSYYQGFLAKFYTPCVIGPINGLTHVCKGDTIFLADTSGGGTWGSGTTAVAVVGSATGAVRGIAAGTVTITYTEPSGCFVTTVDTVIICRSPAQVPTPEKGIPLIFPNPVNGEMTIEDAERYYQYFEIFNQNGQPVVSGCLNGKTTLVSTRQLPPGMYYIKFIAASCVAMQKFIRR